MSLTIKKEKYNGKEITKFYISEVYGYGDSSEYSNIEIDEKNWRYRYIYNYYFRGDKGNGISSEKIKRKTEWMTLPNEFIVEKYEIERVQGGGIHKRRKVYYKKGEKPKKIKIKPYLF